MEKLDNLKKGMVTVYSRFRRAVKSALDSIAGQGKELNANKVRGVAGGCLILLAALVFFLSFVNFVYGKVHKVEFFQSVTYKVEVSPEARADLGPAVDGYARRHKDVKIAGGRSRPDVIIDVRKRPGYISAAIEGIPPLVLKAGNKQIQIRDKKEYWFLTSKKSIAHDSRGAVGRFKQYLQSSVSNRPYVSMNIVGDIIPGRHVAERMAQHGVDYPFKMVAPKVNNANIVFGDLECPLTDRYKAPYTGMTFCAPSKTIEGLKMLGLNVVALANNHSTNFGREAFTDTLSLLKANNMKYTGGGYNYDEAHRPAIMEVKGVKYAFLDYNGIIGSVDATASQPGVAWISMPPYHPDNEQQIQASLEDIKKAKRGSDFVVVGFHWSQEDVYNPSQSQVNLAHRACDSGADMVIGSHPHTIQPIEYYRGKFIAYSLGNFVFDQMQRDQTREGFFLRCLFKGSDVVQIEMVPYKIFDYAQPVVLEGDDGQAILDHVFRISGTKV